MAKFAATDYSVTVNGVDWSKNVAQVELNIKYDDIDITSFGQTSKSRIGGLIDGDVKLDLHQDFAFAPGGTAVSASNLDATLYGLMNTIATVVIKPTSAAVGTGNPTYTVYARVLEYTPFSSSVGDLATVSVTWPLTQNGTAPAVTRAIA